MPDLELFVYCFLSAIVGIVLFQMLTSEVVSKWSDQLIDYLKKLRRKP